MRKLEQKNPNKKQVGRHALAKSDARGSLERATISGSAAVQPNENDSSCVVIVLPLARFVAKKQKKAEETCVDEDMFGEMRQC